MTQAIDNNIAKTKSIIRIHRKGSSLPNAHLQTTKLPYLDEAHRRASSDRDFDSRRGCQKVRVCQHNNVLFAYVQNSFSLNSIGVLEENKEFLFNMKAKQRKNVDPLQEAMNIFASTTKTPSEYLS